MKRTRRTFEMHSRKQNRNFKVDNNSFEKWDFDQKREFVSFLTFSDRWVHQHLIKRSLGLHCKSEVKFTLLYCVKYGIHWQFGIWTLNQKTWVSWNKLRLSCWKLRNSKTNCSWWWSNGVKTFEKTKIWNRRSIFRWLSWTRSFYVNVHWVWQNWRWDWKSNNCNSKQHYQPERVNGKCSSWNHHKEQVNVRTLKMNCFELWIDKILIQLAQKMRLLSLKREKVLHWCLSGNFHTLYGKLNSCDCEIRIIE